MAARAPRYRIVAVGLALLLAGAVVLRTERDGMAHYLSTQRYEDAYYLPPPDWLGVFSLGHREAAAGLIWLRSLIYFSEELGARGEVAHLYQYADAMLTLDRYFKKVYTWVAACAIYRTGNVTEGDVRRSIAYLEQAVRLFPDDGELAWALGGNYLFELSPLLTDPASRAEVRRKGLEHLRIAARMGAGPPWLVLTTATELGKLGQKEREIEHLQDLYDKVTDPGVKAEVENRLAGLRSQAFAEAFKRTSEDLEAARRRDFPYLDSGLYLLVGARPAFDGRSLLLGGFDPEAERMSVEQ